MAKKDDIGDKLYNLKKKLSHFWDYHKTQFFVILGILALFLFVNFLFKAV